LLSREHLHSLYGDVMTETLAQDRSRLRRLWFEPLRVTFVAFVLIVSCGQPATADLARGDAGSAGTSGASTGGSSAVDASGSAAGSPSANTGGASEGGASTGGASTGGASTGGAGSDSGGANTGGSAGTGTYPLPALPANPITDAQLAQGDDLYRTADDLRIAGDFAAAFSTYVELMRLLQGPVGPLASRAHRTLARTEHDLGGLSRWRIEKDIVIGLQHYRASVAHCDVGGCDAAAMGSVARIEEFEREITAGGNPIPPWNPPVY
jgi:hypothetical protein